MYLYFDSKSVMIYSGRIAAVYFAVLSRIKFIFGISRFYINGIRKKHRRREENIGKRHVKKENAVRRVEDKGK